MGLFNGVRKILAKTPDVPQIPSGKLNSMQELEFQKAYRKFTDELVEYAGPVNYKNIPDYYKELRNEQYKEFQADVATFVKTLDDNKRFQTALLQVDPKIVFHLLDRADLVRQVSCHSPKIIPQLPAKFQDDIVVADHIVKYEVSKVRYLPLKYRDSAEFIYRCLSDPEKFKSPFGTLPPEHSKQDVIEAIGDNLKAKIDWYNSSTIIEQLRVLSEKELISKSLSPEDKRIEQIAQKYGR